MKNLKKENNKETSPIKKKTKKKENPNIEKLAKMQLDEVNIAKDYFMQNTYLVGDYIEHGTFGKGIVEVLIGDDKISILFMMGQKILVHSKKIV
jgi:hypothetical protein